MDIDRDLLLNALKLVSKSVDKKNPVTVLTNVCLQFTPQKLVICGMNNSITMYITIPTDDNVNTNVIVDCYLLLGIISKLSTDKININIESSWFIIRSSGEIYKINRLNQYFPFEQFILPVNFITINRDTLLSLIKHINIKTENTRIIYENMTLTLINYDRRRFAINSTHIGKPDIQISSAIHRKSLNELIKLLPSTSINLGQSEKGLILTMDNICIFLRHIGDSSFSYRQFLDLNLYEPWKIDRQLLLQSIDRVLVVTEGIAKFIRMNFYHNSLTMNAFDPNFGSSKSIINTDNESSINCEININGIYLTESLQCFDQKSLITINICNNVKPLIITHGCCYHVIIPIRS